MRAVSNQREIGILNGLLDADRFDATALMGPSQITDSYLLAMAVNRDAVLVTLDTRLMLSAVTGATQRHLHTLRSGENLR